MDHLQTLTADQYNLLAFYYQFLNTIEEGFDYVIESFQSLHFDESRLMLIDIITAFYHIDSSNPILLAILEENNDLRKEIMKFDSVIETVERIELVVLLPHEYELFVKKELSPVFLAWKESVQIQLKDYVTH